MFTYKKCGLRRTRNLASTCTVPKNEKSRTESSVALELVLTVLIWGVMLRRLEDMPASEDERGQWTSRLDCLRGKCLYALSGENDAMLVQRLVIAVSRANHSILALLGAMEER